MSSKKSDKRRERGEGSKALFATISPEYFARFLKIANGKSYGLTIQELIDRANPIGSENSLQSPTD